MKKILLTSIAALMTTSVAFAQSQTPTTSQDTPAVATPATNNAGAPVQGKNSFTEAQAKSRMEAAGFADVADLKLDEQGIWRASANKDAKPVQVSLDYQGNVVQAK
ncbi:PepSY domain-containing protein [Rhizobium tumorigenes]|uniref:PepSY domain-containing protein n=1 Tax=Rhizobium tumorigenes TaxID=2041385 RepID=UPI00241F8280|nr:PepSY domain-containing protein [Rhizobium tumorigenes]WFS00287.1 PepSY domain-containing protein [Rhizobium tumorigenes]